MYFSQLFSAVFLAMCAGPVQYSALWKLLLVFFCFFFKNYAISLHYLLICAVWEVLGRKAVQQRILETVTDIDPIVDYLISKSIIELLSKEYNLIRYSPREKGLQKIIEVRSHVSKFVDSCRHCA